MICLLTRTGAGQEAAVDYAMQIRPILSNACFHCHGPDADTREADLRLDTPDGLFGVRDGEAIIRKGDPGHSLLVSRIQTTDPDLQMPPADSRKTLTDEQRQLLIRWIEQGAEWKQHWAFVAPALPDVPGGSVPVPGGNEIDAFVIQKQQEAGLKMSPEERPAVLVRRVFLDLIGLQPTPTEAEEWVRKLTTSSTPLSAGQTVNPVVWRDLVQHLLNRPEYGERWARRWLDIARYADTNGYEKDRPRTIWPYRDWVINALNADMPFDQFTIEQLAGDMLPNATVDQRIATGFHRNTMLNEEGGIDPLEFRFHAMTDRVITTGTAWLGLTLQCAQCHTHKYDPVSQREFYQLMAFLNNADEPLMDLPDETLDERWEQNQQKAEDLLLHLADHWPVPDQVTVPLLSATASVDGEQKLTQDADHVIQVRGVNPETAVYTVDLKPENLPFDHLVLRLLSKGNNKGPGRTAHGNLVLTDIELWQVLEQPDSQAAQADQPLLRRIPITSVQASVEQEGFPAIHCLDGNASTGWAIHGSAGVPKAAELRCAIDPTQLQAADRPVLRVVLRQMHGGKHTIGAFQLVLTRQNATEDPTQRREKLVNSAFEHWLEQERANAVQWEFLQPVQATSNLPILTIQDDASILASGDTAKRDDYDVRFSAWNRPVTALRLEALPDDSLPAHGPGSTYYEGTLGDFFLTELTVRQNDQAFAFESATETYSKNRFGNANVSAALTFDGDVQTGWSVHDRQGERHVAVYILKEPIPAGQPIDLHMVFGRHFASSLGRFR
ncbi:MAG: DUF1549 domain-containing protein, partial [Planctomycetaceae bacterium]|nr:DUF1549 domain-containing protein [Planctomycetaceae bacterium]